MLCFSYRPAFNAARWERLQKEKRELEECFERELRELQVQQESELVTLEENLRLRHASDRDHLRAEHQSEVEEFHTQHQEQVGSSGWGSWEIDLGWNEYENSTACFVCRSKSWLPTMRPPLKTWRPCTTSPCQHCRRSMPGQWEVRVPVCNTTTNQLTEVWGRT